jgi:hypothetical protein
VRGHTLIAKHEQSEARGASFAHQLANQLSYGRLSPDHRFVFVITQNRHRYNHRKFWHQRTEKSNLDGDASVRMYYPSVWLPVYEHARSMAYKNRMVHVVWLPVWGSEPGSIGAKPHSQPGPAHTANLDVAREPGSTRSPLAAAFARPPHSLAQPRVLGLPSSPSSWIPRARVCRRLGRVRHLHSPSNSPSLPRDLPLSLSLEISIGVVAVTRLCRALPLSLELSLSLEISIGAQ